MEDVIVTGVTLTWKLGKEFWRKINGYSILLLNSSCRCPLTEKIVHFLRLQLIEQRVRVARAKKTAAAAVPLSSPSSSPGASIYRQPSSRP